VPGVVKVKLEPMVGASGPELNTSEALTSCLIASSLRQVTGSPVRTVTRAGLK
jgi:hypothetical protein